MARQLADRLISLASGGPLRREFQLNRQLQAAAQSVCANIAEGFGRYTPGEFARFLRIARGSAMELQEHIHEAQLRGLITPAEEGELLTLCRRVLGSITPLLKYLDGAKRP